MEEACGQGFLGRCLERNRTAGREHQQMAEEEAEERMRWLVERFRPLRNEDIGGKGEAEKTFKYEAASLTKLYWV